MVYILSVVYIVVSSVLIVKAQSQQLSGYPSSSVPNWLDTGSNAWVLTAATLVGLMSVPGLMLFYGGLTKRKYAINTMMMVLYAFSIVLVLWVLFEYEESFGSPLLAIKGFGVLGKPIPILSSGLLGSQAVIPLAQQAPNITLSTLAYFQFVFAAITPALIVGALIERMNFKAWMLFVPLWSALVYGPVAYWLWGGGWLMRLGAVDFSGGYVIHLDAGVAAVIAAMLVGPRLNEERKLAPHNLTQVAAGLGLLWLGWNGFNGGDPYGVTIDASIAVLNTNLAAAMALLAWVILDEAVYGKVSLTGAASGAVAGLVGITPAAGYVNGLGALVIGVVSGAAAWASLNLIQYRIMPLRNIDDATGVFSTHTVPGFLGGVLTGVFADPRIADFIDPGLAGALYGNVYQLLIQVIAAMVVIAYSGLMTFAILKLVSKVTPLRASEWVLRVGDREMHGEVAYDEYAFPIQVGDVEVINGRSRE
ncbi:ammonium transporter [Caldivirga maquilingensis IC-167]|uniref:Ammonium transporter n=2 Tax=Caldivirga maquilingensis TaxID=76887 RepID=A8MCL4_CALMQ|nr:ammonium transporter [Caldivirga maquilingensis IC-167]